MGLEPVRQAVEEKRKDFSYVCISHDGTNCTYVIVIHSMATTCNLVLKVIIDQLRINTYSGSSPSGDSPISATVFLILVVVSSIIGIIVVVTGCALVVNGCDKWRSSRQSKHHLPNPADTHIYEDMETIKREVNEYVPRLASHQ